jgi:pimeloyl-ACP methyl ester carboxylesterase
VDEDVMAPAAKLPPDVRAIAQRFWTQPKFFEALGSQIESIGASAAAIPVGQDFGDVPVVVVSGETNSDAGQLGRQGRLAARSTRGRHVVAERSGHWIPLDRPDVVIQAVREVVAATRPPGRTVRADL